MTRWHDGSMTRLFIASLGGLYELESERLLVHRRLSPHAFELPGCDVGIMVIIALRLIFLRLVLLAEVPSARFFAMESIPRHELSELHEVRDAVGFFQFLIELIRASRNYDITPVFLTQPGDQLECLFQTGGISSHPAVI